MTSRETILSKLHAARQPFAGLPPAGDMIPVVPAEDTGPAALRARFIAAAEALSCTVTACPDADAAIRHILGLVGTDSTILSWDLKHVPLPGLGAALAGAGIAIAAAGDASVRAGLTGVDAALAATGSLLLASGPGKPRGASLLPEVHIAVVAAGQIVPDLETWLAAQRAAGLEHLRQLNSVVMISGPSRTADIAMETVMGVHGPGALQIVLVGES